MKRFFLFNLLCISGMLFSFLPLLSGDQNSEPVRIGVTLSLEGKYKDPSAMVLHGYRLWVEQTNQNGGLLGRPVQLILYDDKGREDLVAEYYEKMITQDHVDLVLSPYGTSLTMTASDVTESHGYVMLAATASGAQIWEKGYSAVFGVYAPAGRYFIGFSDLMARNGFKTIGLVFENSPFNLSLARGVRKWIKRFNISITHDMGFNDAQTEFPRILEQLLATPHDGLIFSGYPRECHQFIDLMKKTDYRPAAMAFTIAPVSPNFYQRIGPFAEGIFGPSQWEPDERIPFPGTRQFIDDFKRFTGGMPTYHAASAYSACQLLEKGRNPGPGDQPSKNQGLYQFHQYRHHYGAVQSGSYRAPGRAQPHSDSMAEREKTDCVSDGHENLTAPIQANRGLTGHAGNIFQKPAALGNRSAGNHYRHDFFPGGNLCSSPADDRSFESPVRCHAQAFVKYGNFNL